MTTDTLARACARLEACAQTLANSGLDTVLYYDPLKSDPAEVKKGHIGAHAFMQLQAAFQSWKSALEATPRLAVSEISIELHINNSGYAFELNFCRKFSWIVTGKQGGPRDLNDTLQVFQQRMQRIAENSDHGPQRNLYWITAEDLEGIRQKHNIRATDPGEAALLLTHLRRQSYQPEGPFEGICSVYQHIRKSDWKKSRAVAAADMGPSVTTSSSAMP